MQNSEKMKGIDIFGINFQCMRSNKEDSKRMENGFQKGRPLSNWFYVNLQYRTNYKERTEKLHTCYYNSLPTLSLPIALDNTDNTIKSGFL